MSEEFEFTAETPRAAEKPEAVEGADRVVVSFAFVVRAQRRRRVGALDTCVG